MERKEEMKKDRETERGGRSKFFGFFSFFFFFNRVRSKVCCYLFWWYGRVQGVEAPDRWKWTFSHLPSRRYHTRVSSLCCVCACPCLKSNSIKFKKKSNQISSQKRNDKENYWTQQLTCPRIESDGRMQCRRHPRPSNGCEGWGSVCWLICNSCLELDDEEKKKFWESERSMSTKFCFLFTVVEEEFVELKPFHEIAKSFRLKRCHMRVAYFPK